MRKIFLDFDDVLFNTRNFVADYKKIFYSFGVSEELFSKNYYGYPVKSNGRLMKYNPEKHLECLEKEPGVNIAGIKKGVYDFVKNTSQYIFPDAADFLKSFPKKELFLLSYGETKFQKLKIKNSGIEKYFSKIIVGDGLKSEMISSSVKEKDENYLLEDRVAQITDGEKRFPFVKTILLKRKEGRYNDKKNKYCEFEAKSLKQALKIINKK